MKWQNKLNPIKLLLDEFVIIFTSAVHIFVDDDDDDDGRSKWPVSSVMSPPTLVTSSPSTWVTSHSSSPDTQSLQTQTLCLSYQTINKLIAFKMNWSHLTLPAKSILCFLLHCVSLPAKVKPNNCIRSTISNDQESCWNNPVLDKLLCLDRKNWN